MYPFFSLINNCDKLSIAVIGGSYGKDGKFVQDYYHLVAVYKGASLDAVREKFGEQGYGVVENENLLAGYNEHRDSRLGPSYQVDYYNNPAYNILKYTSLPEEAIPGSVIFFEMFTAKITSYDSHYSEYDKGMVSTPVFSSTYIFQSPKIPLRNRVVASAAAPALGAGKALAKFGKGIIAGKGGSFTSPLPEMQNENCEMKGRELTLEQLQEVGPKGYGEQIRVN